MPAGAVSRGSCRQPGRGAVPSVTSRGALTCSQPRSVRPLGAGSICPSFV
ncbi:MAG: hypothetical protein MZV64_10375 [Ignavibacteriales bacterium]|nr:hypothetical protein [Ignavibacteriales bacterium]